MNNSYLGKRNEGEKLGECLYEARYLIMAQEMRESTLLISKGYLEEVDFGGASWMAPASLPWDRRMGKGGYSPLLREEVGIPEAGIENLDSDATNIKWKRHHSVLWSLKETNCTVENTA